MTEEDPVPHVGMMKMLGFEDFHAVVSVDQYGISERIGVSCLDREGPWSIADQWDSTCLILPCRSAAGPLLQHNLYPSLFFYPLSARIT